MLDRRILLQIANLLHKRNFNVAINIFLVIPSSKSTNEETGGQMGDRQTDRQTRQRGSQLIARLADEARHYRPITPIDWQRVELIYCFFYCSFYFYLIYFFLCLPSHFFNFIFATLIMNLLYSTICFLYFPFSSTFIRPVQYE